MTFGDSHSHHDHDHAKQQDEGFRLFHTHHPLTALILASVGGIGNGWHAQSSLAKAWGACKLGVGSKVETTSPPRLLVSRPFPLAPGVREAWLLRNRVGLR